MDDFNLVRGNIGEMTPMPLRRTRGALADLSRQMADVAVTLLASPDNQIPSSFNTPASSPEEMVIKLRGQKNPVTWSPLSLKEVRKLTNFEKTPTKDITPTRVMLGLRVSPRKRLQLTENGDKIISSPNEKIAKMTYQNQCKKPKLDSSSSIPLGVALKGLSHDQLINVINSIALINPEVKRMLESSLPEPDLQPKLDELAYLKKNIFKSLPNCRLSSKTDSAAFNRASVHLSAFKKHLMESVKQLVDSKQWKSVVDFTLSAWSHVRSTPQWDNVQHNSVKKHCFKILSTSCLTSLKNVDDDVDWKLRVKERLESLQDDAEGELALCINYLNTSLTSS